MKANTVWADKAVTTSIKIQHFSKQKKNYNFFNESMYNIINNLIDLVDAGGNPPLKSNDKNSGKKYKRQF